MTRFVAVGLVVLGLMADARVARAEGDPLPNNAVLSFFKIKIRENGKFVEFESPDALRRYFNLAHCTCGQTKSGDEYLFAYDLALTVDTGIDRPVDVWVGTNCEDELLRPMNCVQVDKVDRIDSIRLSEGPHIEVPTYEAINVKTTGACVDRETATAWLLFDQDGDGKYDHWVTDKVAEPMGFPAPSGIDVKPPPLPTNFRASGGEGSIVIDWEPPTGTTDFFAFQALCALDDDTTVGKTVLPEPRYQRPFDVCQANSTVTLAETSLDIPDELPATLPPAFANLDPDFLCGDTDDSTAQSLKIDGLTNGKRYKVALLAIDAYGNATGTFFTTTITPKPATDFWEDLNDREDGIEGGCLLSKTYGDGNPLTQTLRAFRDETLAGSVLGRWLTDAYYATLGRLAVESLPARIAAGLALAPLVALALLWHVLTLPGLLVLLALPWLWRRRARLLGVGWRHLRLASAAAAAVVVLAPGLASADDFTPYWEDPGAEQAALDEPGEVKWHAGIRVGPYTPDIDLQFSQNALTGMGPYEAMFGDYFIDGERHNGRVYQIMPMLDVDRILWSRFGQIGVGGSIGYMQKTAYAYADMTDENQPMRERSTAAESTFRLIPMAATATYRFTYLDDRWGIPIVPYVRAGLSYYVWWMKAPDGNLSKVCKESSADDECDEDKAYGGTFGIQGSAGLAIRAERIDADAARSMRNSGIQHAGFYAEVFWARVDGFGSETKLWVGDTTWFAGVNFEF